MTEPRCNCWKPTAPHESTCPVRREQERTPPPIPERGEWDQPMGGWEPRT